MSTVCWRTTAKASSNRRAWSSTGGGGDVAIVLCLFVYDQYVCAIKHY